jgi:hypothetical protein
MRINGNKDRWIYGTFLYTYWESGCYLAPSGYRTGDYRTATQEAWTGELVQSFSAGTHPKRDVTRCATQRAPYRVFVDRDSNNPWTRASSRTSSHGWKFSYLDGGLVGAVTTMESRQVTAKYSLSSGTAYICGKGAPPSSAGVIYTTGTS